jgi:hypothetical protein
MEDHYKRSVTNFCYNNLISLYMDVSESRGFVTTDKRNAYLIKRLKAQYKLAQNKSIKKVIKTMIVKVKSLTIEQQLINLSEVIYKNNLLADAEQAWVDYLVRLQECGFTLKIATEDEPAIKGTMYVIKDQVFHNIQSTGKAGPLGLFLYLNDPSEVEKAIDLINKDDVFAISDTTIFDNHAKLLIDFAAP